MRRLLLVLAVAVALVACDEGASAVKEPRVDGRTTTPDAGAPPTNPLLDAGPDAPADCVPSPKTHLEIINACTNAVKIAKTPTLPRLLADGGLPPLD